MFNSYDVAVGHKRRYEVSDIEPLFNGCGLKIEQFAAQNIPWPTEEQARMSVLLLKNMPWLVPSFTKVVDSMPSAAIRQPINLKPWNPELAKTELASVSTGFFVLKKI